MQRTAARLFFWVFIGGMLGAIARERLLPLLAEGWPPWVGTLLVNVLATFLMGLLYGVSDRLHHHLLQFAAVGFCGGFSTFSHFTSQLDEQLYAGDWSQACLNVLGAVLLGVFAAYVGDRLGQALARQA
jgi:fluoride exporter